MNPFNYVSEYLKGELSVEQQAIFEAALAKDKDLQVSVQEQRALHSIAESIDLDLRAFITTQQKQYTPKKAIRTIYPALKIRRWLLFALLLLICVGIALVLYIIGENKKSKEKTEFPQESILSPTEKKAVIIPVDTVTNQIPPLTPKTPSRLPNHSNERSNPEEPQASLRKNKHKICIEFAENIGEKLLEELTPRVMGPSKASTLSLNNKLVLLDSLKAKNDQLTNLEKISLGYLLFLKKDYLKALEYIEEVCKQSRLYMVDANYLKFTIMAASLPQSNPELKKQFAVVQTYGGNYAKQATELLKQLY